jgi:putative heme iron utilization protein
MAEGTLGGAHEEAATQARAIVRRARSGALATALAGDGGRPYASLVTTATASDGSPLLLLSDLSDHSRNLKADPRASLLLEEASRRANPQTGARITLIGHIEAADDPVLRRRFLARHPGAELYARFADFHVYRMQLERGHFVGGFGRALWLAGHELLCDAPAAFAAAEAETLAALQAESELADRLAQARLALRGDGWQIIAVDPEGADLRRRSAFARLPFPRLAGDAADLQRLLRELAAD